VISLRRGLYLHRTIQQTNIHALSEIRTRDPSNQVAKTYALDRAATGIGSVPNIGLLTKILYFVIHHSLLDFAILTVIKENEVGGTCGTHGRGEECVQSFMGKLEGKNHLEDQGIDGRMGSEWILGRLAGGV
jgi:hypothetical protein